MSLLSRRRRCPYCAERIQSAAVRCRHCSSDLSATDDSVDTAVPPSAPDAEQTEQKDPGVAQDELREPTSGHSGARWLARGVLVLVLALTLMLLALAYRAHQDADDLEASRSARDKVRSLVAEPLEALLSYDYRSFDQGFEDAKDGLTPSFQKQYEPTISTVKERATEQERSQLAYVVGVAPLTYTADRVRTLVFVNTISTSTKGDAAEQALQSRLVVTMVQQSGKWLIDDVEIPLT